MSEYDEFGNLIDSDGSDSEHELIPPNPNDDESDTESSNQLIPSSITSNGLNPQGLTVRDRFGANVTTITPQQQTVDTSEPVIKPHIERNVKVEDDDLPPVTYARDYMINTALEVPTRIKNIAITGNLNSGKTTFIDKFIKTTHDVPSGTIDRYLDNHTLEIKRELTIKASPITLLLSGTKGPSHMVNIIDTPGHINFDDEVQVSLQAVEIVTIIIDVVEGLTFRDKLIMDDVIKTGKSLVIVLNKLDRLILELRLPVVDAYYKLHYIYDEINEYISNHEFNQNFPNLKPQDIIFASSYGICFSLRDFAQLYIKNYNWPINEEILTSKLWDHYFNPDKNNFTSIKTDYRAFVYFILEPIYKLFTYTLTKNKQLRRLLWDNFGVTLHKKVYDLDSKHLLDEVMSAIFNITGYVDVILNFTNTITNTQQLNAQVIKSMDSANGEFFYSLIRIFSGELNVGDSIKISEDGEVKNGKIDEMYISGGRYKFGINTAGPGFLVLIRGVEHNYNKQGLIVSRDIDNRPSGYLPPLTNKSIFKVSIEPSNPKELPKLLEILKKINKSYLSTIIKTEDSGDLIILGTGELMMDCMLHDLRYFYANNFEIRVSDPTVKFGETVLDTSVTKIPTTSVNGDCTISVISEPSNNSLSKVLESGIDLSDRSSTKKLMSGGLDILEARSIWAFTPTLQPSLLIYDAIEGDQKIQSLKHSLEIGFQWSCKEGPLVEEPIKNTKFKILDVVLNGDNIQNAQTIPMMRKACYTGFLTANPRLMEPVYEFYITCTHRVKGVIDKLIISRRGKVTEFNEIPGSNLFAISGIIPVIESIGLETDVRLKTQGQSMIFMNFKNYEVVPGNPLDTNVYLPELKPVPHESIARDFLIKTRNRKGIYGEPNLQKYIDGELFEKLKSVGLI